MRRRAFQLTCILLWMAAAWPGLAQEGHPLTGTWSGDWGGTAAERTRVTLVMNWDGKTISGTLNPGPDAVSLRTVVLDVTDWRVRIDAEGKDTAGAAVPIRIDARLDNIGSYHRTLTGTWQQGATGGDVKLTRD